MSNIKRLRPILDTRVDNNDIYLNDGNIKVGNSIISVDQCSDVFDIINQEGKPFTSDQIIEYIKLLNLDKYLSINRLGDDIVTRCICPNHTIGFGCNDKVTQQSESPQPVTDLIDDSATNQLYNKFPHITEGLSHQIHNNNNVSDYIIFDDCKGEATQRKILLSEESRMIQYRIKSKDRDVEYENNDQSFSLEYVAQQFKIVTDYVKNITDDKFGTYLDIEIKLKKKLKNPDNESESTIEDYTVNKLIKLYEDVRKSNIFLHRKEQSVFEILYNIDGEYRDIFYKDTDEYQLKTANEEMIAYKVLEAVFDLNKLVLYCLDDDVTEYYISSCIVNKVVENE